MYKCNISIAIDSLLTGCSTQCRRPFLPYEAYGLSNGRKYSHLVLEMGSQGAKLIWPNADSCLLNLLYRHTN